MHNGFTTISSVIKLLEHAFLALEDLALRTPPGIRDVFPGGFGRHAIFGIALYGIVDPVTFKTYPACIFRIR
jgi:hypothetical protein